MLIEMMVLRFTFVCFSRLRLQKNKPNRLVQNGAKSVATSISAYTGDIGGAEPMRQPGVSALPTSPELAVKPRSKVLSVEGHSNWKFETKETATVKRGEHRNEGGGKVRGRRIRQFTTPV